MIKLSIIFILIVFQPLASRSQDFTFSQPAEAPVLLNPANAGAQYNLRTNLNFRQQWRSIASPFRTLAASIDGKVINQGSGGSSFGAGLSFFSDVAGEGRLATNQVNISVSGKINLARNQALSAGIFGGLCQRHISTGKLTWGNQYNGLYYDSSIPSGEAFPSETFYNGDFGAGVQWTYGKGSSTLSSNDMFGLQAGYSVSHINSPKSGFYSIADKRFTKHIMHLSGSYGIKNTNVQLAPLLLLQKQGPAQMIYFGSYFKYKLQESSKYTDYILARTISLGGFLRTGDAFVIATLFEFGQIAMGISYDINISSLTKASSGKGGFEISVKYLPIRSSAPSRLI